MNYADLLMDNGELVRIRYSTDIEDELFESLENTMKRGDWWTPSQFDNCTATYMGHLISRVSMRRVVGML